MSNNDDRTKNTDASRLQRGRTLRGRSRGRGFHFNLNAQMAFTQHLMRRGHGLHPSATNAIFITISNFHDAPLNARQIDKNVYPSVADRDNILKTDPVYLYHPLSRQDLQSPLAFTPLSPAHTPIHVENQFLTGIHSPKDPNVITYTIYIYLPHDVVHKTRIRTVVKNQFAHMQFTGLSKSLGGLYALQVHENSTYPVHPELDDEPITNTT